MTWKQWKQDFKLGYKNIPKFNLIFLTLILVFLPWTVIGIIPAVISLHIIRETGTLTRENKKEGQNNVSK